MSHEHLCDTPECSVLVVEDDEEIGSTLFDVLRDDGYRPTLVQNGREALEFLRTNEPPHLIVLDLMMPVMSGWEVLEHLRADPRLARIPVVVTSAVAQQLPGAVAWLRKPYTFEMIFEQVERYCPPAA